MAIRINGSLAGLSRSIGVPSYTAFTACGWCRIINNQNGAYRFFFALDDGVYWTSIGWGTDDVIEVTSSSGTTDFGSSPSNVTGWFFWAIGCDGTGANSLTGYWGAADLMALNVANTIGESLAYTATMYLGTDGWSEWTDAEFAAVKIWDAKLTSEEIHAERWTYLPQRFENLHLFSPLIDTGGTTFLDLSRNARDWTEMATVVAAAEQPPITWQLPSGLHVPYAVSAAATYTATADQGSFVFDGQDAGLLRSLVMTADNGSMALTGNNAGLLKASTIVAGSGSIALTGNDAGLLRSLIVAADSGSYSITGQAANLLKTFVVTADNGTHSITGNDASLVKSIVMVADTGTHSITGQDAGLLRSLVMVADAGSYSLTGNDSGLVPSVKMTADAGTYTATGNNAGLVKSSKITADSGSVSLIGRDAVLTKLVVLTSDSGSYATTGNDTGLLRSLVMDAVKGSYLISGKNVTLTYSGTDVYYQSIYGNCTYRYPVVSDNVRYRLTSSQNKRTNVQ